MQNGPDLEASVWLWKKDPCDVHNITRPTERITMQQNQSRSVTKLYDWWRSRVKTCERTCVASRPQRPGQVSFDLNGQRTWNMSNRHVFGKLLHLYLLKRIIVIDFNQQVKFHSYLDSTCVLPDIWWTLRLEFQETVDLQQEKLAYLVLGKAQCFTER